MNKEYKAKQLPSIKSGTVAQVIRVSDGKEMLKGTTHMACAKRWAKDMNEKTNMGLHLIGVAQS